jgi:putative addiction module component (TIGR02574 family)
MGHPAINLDDFSPEEQLDLLEQIWDRLSQDPANVPLSEAQRRELDRRLDDLDADIQAGGTLGEP